MKHVLIVLFSVAFVGCSSDEKNLDKKLFGTWNWVQTISGDGAFGENVSYVDTPETDGCGQTLEFMSNGTFYWQQVDCDDEGDERSDWYVKDGQLVFDDRGEKSYASYAFDNDTLKISFDDDGYWEIQKWLKSGI